MNNIIRNIFLIFIFLIYIYVGFISTTMNSDRYKYRIIFSILSIFIGISIDYFQIIDKPFFGTLFSSLPLLYLIYYELLRRLFKPIVGKFPYSPYRQKVGTKIIGNGYPKDRKVTENDYIFALTLFLLPFLTIVFLSVKFNL